MTSIQEISLDVICLRKDARQVVKGRVNKYADSMKEIGLQHPITVRQIAGNDSPKKYEMLAGQHRYQAALRLNWDTIPAIVCEVDDLHAELIQIDENLCRAELSPAEEAIATERRKAIYEALHPATAHGGDRKSSRQNGDLKRKPGPKRFTKATAEATGKPEWHVQRAARRGEKIGVADLQRIVGTTLDKPSELDALAALDTPDREKLIGPAAKGQTVTARQPSTTAQSPSEKWRADFSALLKKAPTDADREWAAAQLAETVSGGECPPIPEFLLRDPKARVDAVIEMAGPLAVVEAALPRLTPESRSELIERLVRSSTA